MENANIETAAVASVAEFYDSPANMLMSLLLGGHLHWGYWGESNKDDDFASAADKLAQIMIDNTTIESGQKFIDLGCGVGLPALRLVEAKDCLVDGITISKNQQLDANARAAEKGLQNKARFIHASALDLSCDDQSYDGGWFFESIFHMGHKAALQEVSRVLKPGSTLLLTDLPILEKTTSEFLTFVEKHIHSTFIKQDEYQALLEEKGFELVHIEDITDNVMPHLTPKLLETIEEHKQLIYETVPDNTEKMINNWAYMYEYMSENLGYILVTARKR